MSTPIDSPSAAGHPAAVPAMGLVLDAQALYAELRRGVQAGFAGMLHCAARIASSPFTPGHPPCRVNAFRARSRGSSSTTKTLNIAFFLPPVRQQNAHPGAKARA